MVLNSSLYGLAGLQLNRNQMLPSCVGGCRGWLMRHCRIPKQQLRCSYDFVHKSHPTPQTSQAARIHGILLPVAIYHHCCLSVLTAIVHRQQVLATTKVMNHE